MSTSARRLIAPPNVAKFVLPSSSRSPGPAPSPKLIPVSFAEPGGPPDAVADPRQDLEARELHLPSVSTERVREVEEGAYTKGYARGLEAAKADSTRELQRAQARLEAAIRDIAALQAGVMRRAERELIQLALAMAERVIRREVDLDPDLLLVIARVAVDRLGERSTAVIHVNPDDHALIANAGLPVGVELIADANILPGGCLVTSPSGDVDAGIDAQIREIARDLLGVEDREDSSDAVAVRR